MTALVVPGSASQTSAVVWVGVVNEPRTDPTAYTVAVDGGTTQQLQSWAADEIVADDRSVRYQRLTFTGLEAGRRYEVELRRSGRRVSDAVLRTLPARLPGLQERPFTILLGSCFARAKDNAGLAGDAFEHLPFGAKPDLKILCGDQVYLDTVSLWTWAASLDDVQLMRKHIGTYVAGWTQEPGFRRLLRDGPNLFTSDDHDFWNNAPHPSLTAPDTFLPDGRDRWYATAIRLYEAFQRPVRPTVQVFALEDFSICLADTRIDRDADNRNFMLPADLTAVAAWARQLQSPGALVLGQVPFSNPAGKVGGAIGDYNLANYRQWPELVRAIESASHTILILTGDVHFGRVATATRMGRPDVIEVVASPLSLVFPIPSNEWKPAPPKFPAEAIPGMTQRDVTTAPDYRINANHFATLELSNAGSGTVQMRVRAWRCTRPGQPPPPTIEFTQRFN